MSAAVDEVMEKLKAMTLLEASELVKAIEETFDVDAIAHEKRAVGAPEWESLRRRMERHVDRTASGTALRETTRGMRMRKRVHHAQSYIGSLSVTRVLLKYQPFHQAYLAVDDEAARGGAAEGG